MGRTAAAGKGLGGSMAVAAAAAAVVGAGWAERSRRLSTSCSFSACVRLRWARARPLWKAGRKASRLCSPSSSCSIWTWVASRRERESWGGNLIRAGLHLPHGDQPAEALSFQPGPASGLPRLDRCPPYFHKEGCPIPFSTLSAPNPAQRNGPYYSADPALQCLQTSLGHQTLLS